MAGRAGFSNKLGFIAAAAGSAVGLGNIWKFPYETGANGGASFLIVYLLLAFLIGFPVMVGEIAIGRNTQLNPYGAMKKLGGKRWALVGLFGIISGFMILSFYNVVAGWAFGYFFKITFGDLLTQAQFGPHFGGFIQNDIASILIYSFAFMLLTGYTVARGVDKGIEMAAKVLMPLLLFLLLVLIGYALTLDHAMEGIKFYLHPDLSKIDGPTIYAAVGQAFFSLSLGMGALITYGSYFSKKDNIVSSAAIVTIADTGIAFLAGLLVFPLIYFLQMHPTDADGPGLVFVALPGVFQSMGPTLGRVVGGMFFLLLCFAALTSTISLLEVPVAYVVDQWKWTRKKTTILLASAIFLFSIPTLLANGNSDFFTHLPFYSSDYVRGKVIESTRKEIDLPASERQYYIQLADGKELRPHIDQIKPALRKNETPIALIYKTTTTSTADPQEIITITSIKRDWDFMSLIIAIFSDIGLPMGGCLISLFIALKWKPENFKLEILQGYALADRKGFGKTLHPILIGFLGIMIRFICPLVLGVMFISTVLHTFFGIMLF